MDIFGHRLGHLDAETVQVKIVLIAVLGEPLARDLGRPLTDRHHLEADDVAHIGVYRTHEIGDAKPPRLGLARQ